MKIIAIEGLDKSVVCGVYAIRNIFSSKLYIGSSRHVKDRISSHKHYLCGRNKERPTHKNQHLQRDWDVSGEKAFEFFLLEECPPETLLEREQFYMDKFKHILYNVTDAVRTTLPLEMRENISKGKKGVAFSDEHREALSQAHKGKEYTDKQKASHVGKHNKKLTYEQACEIRDRYKQGGITQPQLAKEYSVSSRSIFDIIHNKYHAERGMTECES